jgi:predicted metal-binding membrane protein
MSTDNFLGAPRSRELLPLDERTLTGVVAIVSAIFWLVMLLLHDSGHGFSHHASTLSWLSGWFIMVMAMMLPPALPFLQAMRRLTSDLYGGSAMVACAAAAFIATWTLAGLCLVTTGSAARLLTAIPWLVDRPTVISGLAAILVGLYQLSPLKKACLIACRSPMALMLVVWNDQYPWRSTLMIGVRYAIVCIGCCWSLMVLTLLVGAFALPLMVVVSVIMLLERLLPSVRPLVPLQASLACGIGLLLLLGSLPPGLSPGSTEIFTHHMIRQ